MLDKAFKAITNVAKNHVVPKNELVVKTLQELRFDPIKPPRDVNGVYVYALVEYGVGKNKSILKLFQDKKIKNAFWIAYIANSPITLLKKVNEFIQDNALGFEITKSQIDVRSELEEFGQVFISVAKRTKSQKFKPYPNWNLDEYLGEFKSLIKEKIKSFCGREFVFKIFNNFIKDNHSGYFTIVGYPGVGKSSIAAKYVYDHNSPCHFNIRSEGRNRPEFFLESIRKQLTKHYELQNTEKLDLYTLLLKVSENLEEQKLVIVVDALDEVEQTGEANILDFEKKLPDGIYFLLTRRPFERDNKYSNISPFMGTLDLRDSQYQSLNRDDVIRYIRFVLYEHPDYSVNIQKWVKEREINNENFIDQLAEKSENNFIYLRYVLPDIAKGYYQDLNLNKLPNGLEKYYEQNWEQMGMEDRCQEYKVIILFILVESRTRPTLAMIAKFAQQGESDVEDVLKEWTEFLSNQEVEGEICYSIYHASFLDFLKGKKKLEKTRKLFEAVNTMIADDLYSDI